jgi:hypothetical protein
MWLLLRGAHRHAFWRFNEADAAPGEQSAYPENNSLINNELARLATGMA